MDMKELLARLGEGQSHSRSTSFASRQPSQNVQYQPPSVSSPIPDTNIATPEPRHGDVLSLNATSAANTPASTLQAPSASVEQTNTLLGLLKLGNTHRSSSRGQVPADVPAAAPAPSVASPGQSGKADALLDLLKRQATSSSPKPALAQSPPAQSPFTFKSPFDSLSQSVANVKDTTAPGTSRTVTHKENTRPDSSKALESLQMASAPSSKVAATKPTTNDVAENWDTAEIDSSIVGVYNFPMRPFTSIEVNGQIRIDAALRDEILMKIASFKKDFDQVDRALTSATPQTIVYCAAKGGGVRIIRQADGANKLVFKGADKQMFNVAIGSADASVTEPAEPMIATNVNGTVYWTSVPVASDFELGATDDRGFSFRPPISQEDPSSTSQLKTRAKLSCRHPEYFAVGRGKSIYIIWPEVAKTEAYMDLDSRSVDSDKYLKERSLKIATGKAGKDFCFSQDDTLIATLDKVGRLKFWDIRAHTDSQYMSLQGPHDPVEAKIPLMTLWAASPLEKSSPTSVMFVDKERPTSKGYALRYMLIGMKQNHTIQLWDLGLGKAVQELNLPHENENDAICSIAYHAKSGMIIVGHPTRNSIYLIHLSAPRYNLPAGITQADFISRLASNDETLPKPESTSIMSGMRELSLATIGELRSLDAFAPSPQDIESSQDPETVFEIYAVHSKGVTCLQVKQQDLGWGHDGKTVSPSDAEACGVVRVDVLRAPPVISDAANGDASIATDSTQRPVATEPTEPTKPVSSMSMNGDKPKRLSAQVSKTADLIPPASASTYASAVSKPAVNLEPTRTLMSNGPAPPPPSIQPTTTSLDAEALAGILSTHFDKLHSRIDADKRTVDASSAARQDAMLRLVSETLTDNTNKVLQTIITKSIAETVVPVVAETVKKSVESGLPKLLADHLDQVVAQQVKNSLDEAVNKALQDQRVLQALSDQVVSKISGRVDADLKAAMSSSLTPAFNKLAADSGKRLHEGIDSTIAHQLKSIDAARQKDSATISDLLTLVSDLSEKVGALTERISQSSAQLTPADGGSSTLRAGATEVDPESAEIKALLQTSDQYQDGLLKWLQSPRRFELFEDLIVKEDITRFAELQPVVALSILATVVEHLDKQTDRRLDLIQQVVSTSDVQDPELRQFSEQVLNIVSQRLQDLYMSIADSSPGSPVLKRVSTLHKIVREALKFAK